MKKLCKTVVLMLVAAILLQLPAFAYSPLETKINAPRAAVYSVDADRFVYNKNSTQECSVASIAKVVTAAVVLENVSDLQEEVVITEEMISLIPFNSSTAGLSAGEVYTYEQLLYCLLVPSGNDAAIALAVAVSGSIDAFSGEMNRYVARLGCNNTGFVNPHGIDELGQYSTAEDLVKILLSCMENEEFMRFFSTYEYELEIEGFSDTYEHTNKMMKPNGEYYYAPIVGAKTGTDTDAGSCLLTLAEKDGFTYITVVLGCDSADENNGPYTYSDTKQLLEDAFNSYVVCALNSAGDIVGTLPVTNMKGADEVSLAIKEPLTVICDKGTTADMFTSSVDIIGEYIAPLAQGSNVGVINYYDENGEFVGSSELVTVEAAQYSKFKGIVTGLRLVTGWQYLIIIAAAVFVAFLSMLIISYVKLGIRRNKRKQGKK